MLEEHWRIACPVAALKNQPLALKIVGKRLVFFVTRMARLLC